MVSSIATVVMTVIMAWGTFTNPVVSQTHYRISDPFTGEVIEEYRVDQHWNGDVDFEEVGP